MTDEVAKSVRDEFCATLQNRVEDMGKGNERVMREVLESMRGLYEGNISALREGHRTEMQSLREGMEEAKSKA